MVDSSPPGEDANAGPSASAARQLQAGFVSFDAASFLQNQEQEKGRKAADLIAAVDALCPTSSEEESAASEAGKERRKHRHRSRKLKNEEEGRRDSSPEDVGDGSKKRRRSEKEERRKKKKRKKERERKRSQREAAELERHVAAELAAGDAARRSTIPFWDAGSGGRSALQHAQRAHGQPPFYHDSKGDPGNVAFGGLYRGDIARYRRYDPTGFAPAVLRGGDAVEAEKERRPAAVKHPRSGKARGTIMQLWRRPAAPAVAIDVPSDGFVPLAQPSSEEGQAGGDGQLTAASAAGASNQTAVLPLDDNEQLLARTRDFNVALQQRPHELQLWLDFAAFQDEAAAVMLGGKRRRGVQLAAAEKKIAILERALEHHPRSPELLLALLGAAERVCEAEEVERRWRQVLAHCPSSLPLWTAYLGRMRRQFVTFKADDVAAAYARALAAFCRERSALLEAGHGAESEAVAEVERGAVALALVGMEFRLQTGHTEAAVAAVRALLEFNFFAPEGWPEDALKAMFEEFWRRGGRQIGYPGAAGWGDWISGEAVAGGSGAAAVVAAGAAGGSGAGIDQQPEEEPEGASGWVELAPVFRQQFGHAFRFEGEGDGDGKEEKEKGGMQGEMEVEEKEDEYEGEGEEELEERHGGSDAAVLARMGLELDAALADAEQELTPDVLSIWLDLECGRDAQQWEAAKEAGEVEQLAEEDDEVEEEGSMRRVQWEEVALYVMAVHDATARAALLRGCFRLFGVAIAWGISPTAASAAAAEGGGTDELWAAASWMGLDPSAVSAEERAAWGELGLLLSSTASIEAAASQQSTMRSTRDRPWWAIHPTRHAFVLRCLETLLTVAPGRLSSCLSAELASAALELASWRVREGAAGVQRDWDAGRALSKRLLAEQSGNLGLWAAHAKLEAASGNFKAARKIYVACLGGAPHPDVLTPWLASLALGWARLELGAATAAAEDVEAAVVQGKSIPMLCLLRSTPQALAAATQPLLWLGSGGSVPLAAKPPASGVSQQAAVEARRGFQDSLLRVLRGGAAEFKQQQAAVVSAAAACELLLAATVGSSGRGGGVPAALALYSQILDSLWPAIGDATKRGALSSDVVACLEVERCAVAVDAAVHGVRAVPPAEARGLLLRALHRSPGCPSLLHLLRTLERSAQAAGAVRRHLSVLLAEMPTVQAWAALVGVQVEAKAPHSAIRAAFQRAVDSFCGSRCPALWRLFLRFEAAANGAEALRRVFLRALEACPWSKAVWVDGLALLNGRCPPRELTEYLGVMRDKEVAVRSEVLEAVLLQMEATA